jgi:hypothetical protein
MTGATQGAPVHDRAVPEGGKFGFIMSTTVGEMEGCKPNLVMVCVPRTKEYDVYS